LLHPHPAHRGRPAGDRGRALPPGPPPRLPGCPDALGRVRARPPQLARRRRDRGHDGGRLRAADRRRGADAGGAPRLGVPRLPAPDLALGADRLLSDPPPPGRRGRARAPRAGRAEHASHASRTPSATRTEVLLRLTVQTPTFPTRYVLIFVSHARRELVTSD